MPRLPLALRLVLRLLRGLADRDLYLEILGAATRTCAGDWRGVAIVEPAGDADIGVVGRDAVGRIEGDPAEIADPAFGPGVRCLLRVGAVAAEEVAGNVAGRDLHQPRGGDEHMREILADAVACGGGLL